MVSPGISTALKLALYPIYFSDSSDDSCKCATSALLIYSLKVCATAQKMRVGPSEPVCRSRLQTTSSCIGKEPFVVSVEEKAWQKTVSGEDQGDERKRITDEVSKYQRWRQNWGACRSPG